MKPGQPSQTAILVAAARAAAHGRTPVAKFQDPTAIHLLPDDARARVERFRAADSIPPRGFRSRFEHEFLARRAPMMVARTVAIDDAIRERNAPQVVIWEASSCTSRWTRSNPRWR